MVGFTPAFPVFMRRRRSASWFLIAAIQELWRRFRLGFRDIPASAWRQWGSTIATGFGITAIATAILTRLGQFFQERGLQAWDESLLRWILDHAPMSFAQGITWQSPGNLVGMLPVVLCAVAIAAWSSRALIATTLTVAYILQFAIAWTGWGFWSRDRPNLVADGIAAPGLHAFPSGHALVIMTVHGLIAYLWLRAARSPLERLVAIALFLIWMTLIGLSRLVLGAHWPTDIIAGYLLGFLWLLTLVTALHRAEAAARK